jgi:hypothetical protein
MADDQEKCCLIKDLLSPNAERNAVCSIASRIHALFANDDRDDVMVFLLWKVVL